jgi:hypothetical protein
MRTRRILVLAIILVVAVVVLHVMDVDVIGILAVTRLTAVQLAVSVGGPVPLIFCSSVAIGIAMMICVFVARMWVLAKVSLTKRLHNDGS